jgi:hypothetical protein
VRAGTREKERASALDRQDHGVAQACTGIEMGELRRALREKMKEAIKERTAWQI